MQKILVTGGNGYVGGRVVQHLRMNPAYDIKVGTRSASATEAANTLQMNYDGNESLIAACTDIHTVLHFSAMNENDCIKDPVAALQSNGVSTARLLDAAQKCGVKRFLYLSTAHVYAAPLVGYIDEQTLPKPQHPYATSHLAAEHAVLAAHYTKKIECLVVRMSNSFGAPVDPKVNRWTLLVNDLCIQAVHQKELTLRSSGVQRRDFITLKDVATAMAHMIQMPNWHDLDSPILNLGGNWSPTVYEVATLVAEQCNALFGYTPKIVRAIPLENELTSELKYSITKLINTGFQLSGDVKEEIATTLMMQMNNERL